MGLFSEQKMQIEQIALSTITPYAKNNRTHPADQIERIAASIKHFGFNQPVVIDENNVCLVGHGRLLAAQKLGLDKIPTLKKTELSEKQKRAYRILDNKLQNDSTWEFENLESELKLLEAEGFELEPWGLESLRDLFPSETHALSNDELQNLEKSYKIEIDCVSEGDQQIVYERLTKEGLKCRLLSL